MTMGLWMYFWDTDDWDVAPVVGPSGRGKRTQDRRRRFKGPVRSILEIMKDKRENTEEMMKQIRRHTRDP